MQKSNKADILFTRASPAKVFVSLSLPVVMGMVVTLVYNLVDAYFVGQLGDANQMAAVSLCSPLFMLVMGIGNIFGIGGSSVVSRLMGQQKRDLVRRASSMCLWVGIAVGMVLLLIGLTLRGPMLGLLGADPDTRPFASQYYLWFMLSAPIMMIQFTLMNLLRCDGAAGQSMIGSIIGSVVNMILDPVLIFACGLGVAGAAIATVIGNACAAAFFVYAALRKAPSLSLSLKDFALDWSLMGGVLAIGLPASVTNALTSVATVLMNNLLLVHGNNAIAAMGIASRVNQIVILLQIGFASGLPPVIGYNWGARNMPRLRQILRAAVIFSVALGIGLTAFTFVLAPTAIRLFMRDETIVTPGAQLLRGLMLCGPFLGVLFIITNFFQATGKALPAMLLSLCRQGVIFVAVLFPFNAIFGWNGLVYAQPTADYLTLLIALLLFLFTALPALRGSDPDQRKKVRS